MSKYLSNQMVAHVWAQQEASEGRNRGDTFWFQGPLLDAQYTRADGIACFTNGRFDGKPVVLITSKPNGGRGFTPVYSSIAYRAIDRERYHIMNVPYVTEDNRAKNVTALYDRYTNAVGYFLKPHVGYAGNTIEKRIEAIIEAAKPYREYCMAFGLEEPNPNFDAYFAQLRTNFDRYYNPKAVGQRDARAAIAHRREATIMSYVHAYAEGVYPRRPLISSLPKHMQREAKYLIDPYIAPKPKFTVEQWQNGEGTINSFPYSHGLTWDKPYPLLRRNGERLETSMGAQVPWLDAVRAFQIANKVRCQGRPFHPVPGHIRVGGFNVDRIDADGTLKAGCHTLSYDEMLRLAIKEVPHVVKPCYPVPALVREIRVDMDALARAISP